MRVTNSMLVNQFMRDTQNNLGNMQTIQKQLTSGKTVNKPSDDPLKVSRIMQLNRDLKANEQYNKNISSTINYLDTADTALGQLNEVIKSINENILAAGNGAYSTEEREAIRNTINEQIGHMGQILNTNFDGKYIFGGTRTGEKPVEVSKDDTGTNHLTIAGGDDANELKKLDTKLVVEVSQGVTLEYTNSVTDLFTFTNSKGETKDIRDIMDNIMNNLASDDPDDLEKLTSENLTDIQDFQNHLLKIRSEVGAMQNRMEDAQSKNEDETYNMTEILSQTEDIDFAETVINLMTLQSVYQASLQVSSKVLQPTLIDYV
ncbi:flagellar hook-associated protein 3 [Clostridium bornimense]|uniref:Flagellar hook-associated protein 3 n=1 Tax=Clostridium bornimense TaxID=1216932 RepID=W6RYZ6_9CLOT|nr:flagellar hook-associated protein FlgL [Clostridium bornimense]CDM68839.1 flagellar hook-associated protein 3 [Clostridium bornimense]